MAVVLISAAVLYGILISQCVAQQDSKQVKIVLNSNWPNTPLLLEASEFVAGTDEVLFWNFIQTISNIDGYDSSTPKDQYDTIIATAQSILTPSVSRLLPFSLSLRVHSPKVQMLQQVSSEVFSASSVSGEDCVVFVTTGDRVTCDVSQVMDLIHSASVNTSVVHSFDHCFPSVISSPDIQTVIVHGEIGTPNFVSVFNAVWPEAKSGRIRICLRHWVVNEPKERARLSGYGVQLAVKSTEYKAVDDTKVEEGARSSEDQQQSEDDNEDVQGFVFTTLKSRYPNLSDKLDEFQHYLVGNLRELPELKAWQVADLGVQAVHRITESEDVLKEMRDLSQNLPILAKSLSNVKVENSLKTGIEYNQRVLETVGIMPGASVLLLNGIVIQDEQFNIYSMLTHIKSEYRMLSGLQELGLPSSSYQDILSVKVHPTHTQFTIDMRSSSVIFINDIEKDPEYSRFSNSVYDFLRPTFPGSLRYIRKNAFNLVFVFDPLSLDGLEILEYVSLFLQHHSPFRLGVLLVPSGCGLVSEGDNTLSETFSVVLTYLLRNEPRLNTLGWALSFTDKLDEVAADEVVDSSLQLNITLEEVFDSLKSTFQLSQDDISSIISESSEYSKAVKDSCSFYIAKGLPPSPQVLINGVLLDLEEEDIETAIVTEVQRQTSEIQQLVFSKRISDHTNMYEYFMNRSNVLQRLNQHVTNTASTQIDLSDGGAVSDDIKLMSIKQISAAVRDKMAYFTSLEGEFENKALTFWVIADFESVEGIEMLTAAVDFTSSHEDVRLGLLPNPAVESSTTTSTCSLYLEALLLSQRPKVIHDLIKPLVEKGCGNNAQQLKDVVNTNEKFKSAAFESKLDELSSSTNTITLRNLFIKNVLGLLPGQQAILSNGRLIGPLSAGEKFGLADFSVLHSFESDSHARAVLEQVQDLVLPDLDPDSDTAEYRSELSMRLASLRRSEQKQKRLKLPVLRDGPSVINLPPDEKGSAPLPTMSLVAIIDPLTSAAQRVAPMLMALLKVLPFNVTLTLNPHTQLSEMPLKDFYRSVLESTLSFGSDGTLSPGPSAIFSSLPQSPLFTLNLDVPHSWMVQSVYSPYDLDNIHMASVEREVYAEYQLEYILVEGQCFDAHSDSPTAGLEIVMGSSREPNRYDTIVMANLGYFQLKGAPGSWNLKLRDGRSSDVYQISSYRQYGGGGSNTSPNQTTIPIVVDSFDGAILVLRVEKKPGMVKESLLKPDDEEDVKKDEKDSNEEGFMGSMFGSLFGDSKEEKPPVKGTDYSVHQNETINIFSLASGHLYERFLRIMMLSVLKHTKNPVKFWFLKNFLSPLFKDFIPKMAEEYKFEYELVQYKWPRWLLAQTEKQRIIWGYKILFLDVLFPLNVKKIIFVDADQIVRTNMKELLEVPLDGAPYGYTPFCDDRKEMDGFRFWNSGYWRNHLGKRSYHISALYVIDLKRFRLLAAGDRLRGQYQMLSQDPNSLANLDQDLPNNMIHNVPIKSLPQEWLWCETWCSDESKPQAKTIDLCNNPLTKEPKLKSAMRIVPEWSGYDEEIKKLQERVSSPHNEEVNKLTDSQQTHLHREL